MSNPIKVEITTLSNLFIGGAPAPFEIGGVDQYTATTHEGDPYIPASSFKGALRNIVREDHHEGGEKIADWYCAFLQREKESSWEYIIDKYKHDEAVIDRIKKRYEMIPTAQALFGLEGLNTAPKLLFGDLNLKKPCDGKSKWFCLDAKASIETKDNALVSNPRTYQVARSGLVFEGEILLHKIELLDHTAVECCRKYLIDNLKKFNDGFYRLGNSKSRGYGRIEVRILNDCGVWEA